MENIIVRSRQGLETFAFDERKRYMIISITDPENDFVKISPIHKIIRLQFHDLDEDRGSYKAMANGQARLLAEWIMTILSSFDIDYIIVQCEAGISRSAGIAAAISKWLFNDDMEYFNSGRYVPNRRCYKLVLESLSNISNRIVGETPERKFEKRTIKFTE